MVAGVMEGAGYKMGDHLWAANLGNPKGIYESRLVNALNEDIIRASLPPGRRLVANLKRLIGRRSQRYYGWIEKLPVGAPIGRSSKLEGRTRDLLRKRPYCLKDPRFCYTFPAWYPFIEDGIFICVFREPGVTAMSIVTEFQRAEELKGAKMDLATAMELWTLMYSHVLKTHRHQGKWVFLHFQQLLNGQGLDRLESAVGAKLNRGFPDPTLQRSKKAPQEISAQASQAYEDLCRLADYTA